MDGWRSPELSFDRLKRFGDAPAVRLHDTTSSSIVTTRPGPTARMYVCGITPYDATHVGHAATYVAFDLVLRAWRSAGHDVHYVQNVTDVDDPLLERAAATGEDWDALAERETELFRDDMAALRVVPPTHYIGAVESIPAIVDLIGQLRAKDAVYDLDGDLYFPIAADPSFGSVSRLDRDGMLALFGERGGDPDRDGKQDPLDPLLWTRQRGDQPGWSSPLGKGRPGWHIECSAIALQYLGIPFDVQGGGSDLIFPHHEMCASGAEVATSRAPFAYAYVHAGMVGLDGAKMSKSKGNLVFVSTLREEGVDPMAIRLALLAHHYRTDWDWDGGAVTTAAKRLDRWRSAVDAGGPDATPVVADVRQALADDIDAPGALAAVDAWADAALSGGTTGGVDGAAEIRAVTDLCLGVAV
jgi:L-cysteine:1D-myo-inositol 2-amino-2-deoxy-alpha-D-glucopyranoside ligase